MLVTEDDAKKKLVAAALENVKTVDGRTIQVNCSLEDSSIHVC